MGNYTPTDPNDEAPLLAQQRRSLDVMSAQLTHNLNLMIAEQEARVKSFAAQHPTAKIALTPDKQAAARESAQESKNMYGGQVTEPPQKQRSAPKKQQTPPPPQPRRQQAPQQQVPQQQSHPAAPPPVPQRFPKGNVKPKKKEEGIGTVPMLVIVAVIIMLLRACN